MIRGVFIPSILTIFGVIMYLRLGWMVFHVGIVGSVTIITISSLITFMTGLSIAATATNMKVGAGGAYYMISRSFGIEAGAAIGIPLFFAQALGIAFYITGFSESLSYIFPELSTKLVSLLSLGMLTAITLFSAEITLKIQSYIFAIICLSLASFYLGDVLPPNQEAASKLNEISKLPFWSVFAVIFPAVTGIEAGLAMSGELKNPSKALPTGTLLAVLMGFGVYISIPILLYYRSQPSDLASNYMIMKDIALVGGLIVVGLWGSTISSALGSLMGAPRTLQALAKDRVVFDFFGKASGEKSLPQRATLLSAGVALIAISYGNLNSIATVLTMFFLTSYGFLNIAACIESLMGNPSWRPSFRTHWSISLVGAISCLFIMLMIDAGATIIATVCVVAVFISTKKRELGQNWSDTRRGILLSLARYSIYHLSQYKADARTWRPNILVLSGSPQKRWEMIQLGHALTKNKGFLTVGSVLEQKDVEQSRKFSIEESIKDFLKKNGIQALAEVHFAQSFATGSKAMISNYGVGTLKPNLLMLGDTQKEDKVTQYCQLIMDTHRMKKNILIFKNQNIAQPQIGFPWAEHLSSIDVWWGRRHQNANLMLALAYLISSQNRKQAGNITLKSTILHEDEKSSATQSLNSIIEQGRLKISHKIYTLGKGQNYFDMMARESESTGLVFMGIRPPEENESCEEYAEYYRRLMGLTQAFPKLCMVLASEEVQFKEIFR